MTSITRNFYQFELINSKNGPLRLLEPRQKRLLLLVIFAQVVAAISELISLWLLTKIMSSFIDNKDVPSILLTSGLDFSINAVLILVVVSTIFAAIVKILSQAAMIRYVQTLRKYFSKLALQNFQKHDFIELKNAKKSETTKTVLTEADQIVQYFFQPLTILTSKLSIIFIFVTYSFFQYTFEMITVFLLLFMVYITYYTLFSNIITHLGSARNEANALRVTAAEDFIRLAKDFKLSDSRNYLLDHFEIAAEKFKEILAKVQIISFVPRYFVEAFAVCLLCFGIYLSTSNIFIIDIEFLVTILIVAYRVLPAVQGAFASKQSMDFAQTLFSGFEVSDKSSTTNFSFSSNIEIRSNKDAIIKNGLRYNFKNIQIKRGERIIITGASGVGKTTFLEIILGLRHNPSVIIEYDGMKISAQQKIKNFAYVEQHPNLFNASVLDNICLRHSTREDQKQIINLAKTWNDADLLNLLEANCIINDEGTNLSGGQRQKIALIRQIQRSPDLLVLDEATSGFDSVSLKKFLDFLDQLDTTVIWVTHDQRIAKMGTKVLELHDGEDGITVASS